MSFIIELLQITPMIFQFGWLFQWLIIWLINVSNPPESCCGMWNTSSVVRFLYLLVLSVTLFMLSCFISRTWNNHRSHLTTFQIVGSILMITKFSLLRASFFSGSNFITEPSYDVVSTRTTSYFNFSVFATINVKTLFWQSNFLSWDENIKLSKISFSENHGKSFTRCRFFFFLSRMILGLFRSFVRKFRSRDKPHVFCIYVYRIFIGSITRLHSFFSSVKVKHPLKFFQENGRIKIDLQ